MSPRQRISRPERGRLIGGVCAGLSRHWELDVTLVRFAFLALTLASGLGLALYVLAWLLLPSSGTRERASGPREIAVSRIEEVGGEIGAMGRRVAERLPRASLRSITSDRGRAAMVVVGAGAVVLLGSFGLFDWITPVRALGLAAVAVGAAALIRLQADAEARR